MSNSDIKIVKREEWKAVQPKYPYINIFPERIVVHHYEFEFGRQRTKTSKYFKGCETILYLQNKHIKKMGLNDIKYHFIIAPDGTVYEGRPLGTAGCHCKSYDNTTIGILFFGNYNIEDVGKSQLRSFMLLLKYIKSIYKHMNIPKCIKNHRDYELTLCPGHHLSNLINIIKTREWNF
jgi:hypothetical protein